MATIPECTGRSIAVNTFRSHGISVGSLGERQIKLFSSAKQVVLETAKKPCLIKPHVINTTETRRGMSIPFQ